MIDFCPDCIYPLKFLEGRHEFELERFQATCPKCYKLFTGYQLEKLRIQKYNEFHCKMEQQCLLSGDCDPNCSERNGD